MEWTEQVKRGSEISPYELVYSFSLWTRICYLFNKIMNKYLTKWVNKISTVLLVVSFLEACGGSINPLTLSPLLLLSRAFILSFVSISLPGIYEMTSQHIQFPCTVDTFYYLLYFHNYSNAKAGGGQSLSCYLYPSVHLFIQWTCWTISKGHMLFLE